MKMATINLGSLSDNISEQLAAQGVEQQGSPSVEMLDRLADSITLLFLNSCLTEAETARSRKKLIKQIKVRRLAVVENQQLVAGQ